ncbi:MAG: hypothetical protein RB191_03060 [Terriglobia bacterium]|nr:hypothetical protein [Terriglobia bacterium]
MTMQIDQFPAKRKAAIHELPGTWAEIARRPESWPSTRDKPLEHAFFLNTCMNADCKTSWLRLWRWRHVPRFEGQWACSPECMRALVERAVERELGDGTSLEPIKHNHRIPLGLLMLSLGWITQEQLRRALDAQRATGGKARIGAWLMQQSNLSEEQVTRALSMQWGCPVLSLTSHQPETVSTLVPRILLDTYGMVPLRTGSARLAYLAFEDRMDSTVALAVERMSGIRIEAGVVTASQFLRVHERMMGATFPKAQLLEVKTSGMVAKEIAAVIERVRPHQAKLVRMRRYFWLRLWHTPEFSRSASGPQVTSSSLLPRIHQVEDVLISLRPEHAS